MITLQFVREASITSSLIAWFSQGTLSHVEAVIDGQTFGSYEERVGRIPAGVQWRPLGYHPLAACVRVHIPVGMAAETKWRQFLSDQLGKPYDWRAIGGFIFGRDWREQDSWICSELQAAALEEAGVIPKLWLAANKITPVALMLAISALKDRTIEIVKQG